MTQQFSGLRFSFSCCGVFFDLSSPPLFETQHAAFNPGVICFMSQWDRGGAASLWQCCELSARAVKSDRENPQFPCIRSGQRL